MRKTQTNKNSVHWAMGKEKILAFTLLIGLMWVIPVYAFDFSDWEVLIKKHVRPKTVDGILINAVDYQAGSADLISIRSRGQYTRPFEVVQNLKREAEARYLESADQLQLELVETEQRLSELESQKVAEGQLTLNADQEAALIEFQDRKLMIRKQLRDVRHQLDQDIEDLGATLKLLNIAVLPLLITLLLGLIVGMRRARGAGSS